MIALAVVVAVVTAQGDARLVGTWGMGGEAFVTFKANGTGTMEGEPFQWKAKGGALTLTADGETDRAQYQLSGEQLVLSVNGIPLTLQRMGKAARAAPEPVEDAVRPAAATAPSKPVASSRQDKQIAQLLTKNAWCSFSFKGGSTYTGGSWGSTSRSRVVFSPNGVVTRTSGSETTNSGANGMYAGAGSGGDQGYWKIKGGQLHLSADGQEWAVQPVEASLNSNGSPILKSGGVEYMVCD